MSELVEWNVGYHDDQGAFHQAADGAATVFGESRAKQLAKKLGHPYRLFHWRSKLEPAEHKAQEWRA